MCQMHVETISVKIRVTSTILDYFHPYKYGNVSTNPLSPKCLLPDRHVTLNISSTFDDSFFQFDRENWVVLNKVHDKECLISLSSWIQVTIIYLH